MKAPARSKFCFVKGVYEYRGWTVEIDHPGSFGSHASTWTWKATRNASHKIHKLSGSVWGGLRSAQGGAGYAIDYAEENGEVPNA
jgi:hypothetical protein